MRKEWEGERKAILSLIASPGVERSNVYRVIKTPVNHQGTTRQPLDSVPCHVTAKETASLTFCDTETVDSSYLETETFVMNFLNELDG
eukprot:scaffold135704_cov33-Cyclotella_meneghiniana.AAC.2